MLEQSYTNLSYAVVDAGSTDNTLEILGAVSDPRLKWISERDRGPADGLNKGFQIAAGDICCYVNADDAFLPGALATIVEEFARHPADDVIYGNGVQIDQNGQPVRYLIATRWNLRALRSGGGGGRTLFNRQRSSEERPLTKPVDSTSIIMSYGIRSSSLTWPLRGAVVNIFDLS